LKHFVPNDCRDLVHKEYNLNNFDLNKKISSRLACGEAVCHFMDSETDNDFNLVTLDGDVGNSTFIEVSAKKHPNRFIQGFIAEQNIVQISQGLSCLGIIPVLSSFSAFLTRAYDQFRMNNINQCNIKVYGTHSGSSIGEDGGSQMGFEDISMFSQLFNCVVLYPTDGFACYHAMKLILNHKGMCYIKASRPDGELL